MVTSTDAGARLPRFEGTHTNHHTMYYLILQREPTGWEAKRITTEINCTNRHEISEQCRCAQKAPYTAVYPPTGPGPGKSKVKDAAGGKGHRLACTNPNSKKACL